MIFTAFRLIFLNIRIYIKKVILKYFLRINDIRIFAYNVCSCKILIEKELSKERWIVIMSEGNNTEQILNEINSSIVKIINNKMNEFNLSQKTLSEKTKISQPTISKLLSKKANFSTKELIVLSDALKINLMNVAYKTYENFGKQNFLYEHNNIPESDNFVINTTRHAFNGYIGNSYYLYYKSTITYEEKIIEGTIEFNNTENNRCSVKMKIFTGALNEYGDKIYKEYYGDMIISIPLSTCYISLKNQKIGEISYIMFHHMFLNNNPIKCRVGAALTTSCSENKRPTMHRIVLSQTAFDLNDAEDALFLDSQLNLNGSKIVISEQNLKQLLKDSDVEEMLDPFAIEKTKSSYYILDEEMLLNSPMSECDKISTINKIRKYSVTDDNIKINTSADRILFNYINSINI